MAKYGASYLYFAPFAASNPDADAAKLPKYGTKVHLGSLITVVDNVNVQSAEISGDDAVEDRVDDVADYDVSTSVTELENAVASAVFGSNLSAEGDLSYSFDDEAPQGGLGFISKRRYKGKVFYKGIFYPKVQAVRQGVTYNTKGTSIQLTGDDLSFHGTTPACRKSKIESKALDTEAAAQAWVDGKFTESAS
nr:MAG TPA: tail tube protein [Caudoviricetes sp.]